MDFPGGSDIKRLSTMPETRLDPWVGKITWRRKWQSTPVLLPGKIPWIEEPGRVHGSQRVAHDFTFTFTFTSLLNI